MKHITFTVTTDLTYDQRMQRICGSMAMAGYQVLLIGRKLKSSKPLKQEPFKQKRLPLFFEKGKLMYLEYNLRLLFTLLFTKTDCYCAIDLDTILPAYFASVIRHKKRVYDAHELFTEQKEIVTRPAIHKMWLAVERFAVPKFPIGYTVNDFIVDELKKRYGVLYGVVRNLPKLNPVEPTPDKADPFVIYQGAVNEGRSFETLIPAMKAVDARLVICGNGNFFDQVKQLVRQHDLESKIELKGMVPPEELKTITPSAYAAVMLFENTGLNQYQSLANRFFDYIMAGVPQICVNYPQYRTINDKYGIAYLVENTDVNSIANGLNNLLSNDVMYTQIQQNCLKARLELNWQSEEKTLIRFYEELFKN